MTKCKSSKKLSLRVREEQRFNEEMERIVDETHCRFGFDMGVPCNYWHNGAVCGVDAKLCDLETEKGRKFLREYECEDV